MAKKYSLVMGIENYPGISGQTKVSYAINDAKSMAEYARKAGFHLIDGKPLLDGEATYKKVIEKLRYLFHIAEADDFILLYFAGHGFYSEDGGYLIPFDYQKENAIDESSCISFDSIDKRYKNKKTRYFIFFLDTCHSGYAGKQMDIRGAGSDSRDIHITLEAQEKVKSEMEALLQKGEKSRGIGRLIFTSSAPTEKSHHSDDFQHGLFTYYLLSSLKVKTNEKQVNVEDLVRSVKDNVIDFCLRNNWEQTPTAYSNIQGAFYLPAYEIQPRKGKLVSAPNFSLDIQKARKALQSRDFDAATQIINTILQKDRLNFEANLLLEELDTGRNLQILEKETEIRQNYEEWFRRGEEFRKAGDFSKARECFENAAGIFPDSQMAQSYIKEIETRQQIIEVDDIEVPAGDKAVILKNLFQAALDAFNAGEFTTALNHYNKILKTYPGNQRAIKEKKQLFEKWLQQYKDNARYLEMLGLFENIILPDESLRDEHVRFEEEYNETVLLYTQVFLKSRISSEIEQSIKESDKKEERKKSYEKLMAEYHELAMEAEYDKLLKITDKLKSELDHTIAQIKLKTEIIGTADIFKTQKKVLSDHIADVLESVIKEGVSDRYILNAYKQIRTEKTRLLFNKMPVNTVAELSEKLKLLKKIDRSEYDLVKFDIASEILLVERRLKDQKKIERNRRYKKFYFFSLSLYFMLNLMVWFTIFNENGGIFDYDKMGYNAWEILFVLFLISFIFFIPLFRIFKNRNINTFRENIYRIILSELGKFGLTCSIPFISFMNMARNPKTFINWNLLFAILIIYVSYLLFKLAFNKPNTV
jgi:tetratricopeptide (TPR) repeat protein